MAATKTDAITALGGILVVDFDADTSVASNVTGNTSGTLFLVDVDNTANTSTSAYVKIKDASSANQNSAGTLVPHFMFVAPPGAKVSYAMPDGQPYSSGLSVWCTTSNAAQNTSDPSNAVVVRLVAS
tara:strand:+ start:1650 stop:2030 length:381 start_codon:yes stop_codon:yes gene_type:complete